MIKKIEPFKKFFAKNPLRLYHNIKKLNVFFDEFKRFKEDLNNDPDFSSISFLPFLDDKLDESGNIRSHYFLQDLIVANKIFENAPKKHVDIGSRVDGFVAHVAAFREIEVFDIRPLTRKIKNIKFIRHDFTSPSDKYRSYADSISCLHALEHFGLGRYNDPIDAQGHIKGFHAITDMLQRNGKFYFSVPIGPQRIEFNAHRVFSLSYLLGLIKEKYSIDDFSYLDDDNNLFSNFQLSESNIKNNFNCTFGCAIFDLRKK